MCRIHTGGDVVLLLLPLVVPYHQPCRTRGGEVRHDGRAKGYHQVLEEVPHAVVHSHCCIHFFSVPPFCLFSGPWGNRSLPPKIPDSTQTSSNQPKIPNSNQFLIISPVRKIFFPYWKRDFLRAFLSHDKGTTSARGNHTIRYDAVRFSTIRYDSTSAVQPPDGSPRCSTMSLTSHEVNHLAVLR